MTLEVQIQEPGRGTRTLVFGQSPVRVGRNQLNEIALDDRFVSEWHGIIRFDAGSVAYFDLGSTNGSVLDGQRLQKNIGAALTESSRLVLGKLQIQVRRRGQADEAAPSGRQRQDSGGPLKTLAWHRADVAAPPGTDQFAAYAVTPPPPRSGTTGQSGAAVGPETPPAPGQWPGAMAPRGPAQPESVGANGGHAARQEKVLQAFCEAFVGLRKGYEQFGSEVGVRIVHGSTAFHRARSSSELMQHLMDERVAESSLIHELIAVFADLGIHHIALMEGITEGVRSVLQSMDPRANDLEAGARLFTASKAKAQWKQYLERFDHMVTDDNELHAAIFGEEFARAYASVSLGHGRESDGKK